RLLRPVLPVRDACVVNLRSLPHQLRHRSPEPELGVVGMREHGERSFESHESSLAETSIWTASGRGHGCQRTRTHVRRPHAGHRMNEWYFRTSGRCSENGMAARTSCTGLTGVSRRQTEQSTRKVPANGWRCCAENRAILPSGSRSGGTAAFAPPLGCRDLESPPRPGGRRRTVPSSRAPRLFPSPPVTGRAHVRWPGTPRL